MKRNIYQNLLAWKDSRNRKPLLLQGARQVGKSYILKEFGKREFPGFHSFNFEQNRKLIPVFEADLNPERIIRELSISSGKKINIKSDLIILDEIQECPNALTSLKYFMESMPELCLCGAGSLLGVKLSGESFPVGKVENLGLFPMNFEEFLTALDDNMSLEILKDSEKADSIPEIAHQRLWDRLKEYYITGGMPEVVERYISMRDDRLEAMKAARKLQKDLVDNYSKDFAKHSGKVNSMHIAMVFENIPMQLARNIDGSVKRYQFKNIIPKKKSFPELAGPIDWLEKAGLVLKVKICNKAELPLESFCKNNIFKLFIFDIGLLGSMLELPFEALLNQDFGIAKGYFAENLAAQEFRAGGISGLYSWTEGNSEIEFLRVINGKIVPVEVKSGRRTQAKSLKRFLGKYHPERAIKLSGNKLSKSKFNPVENYPLYMAARL